MNNSSIRSTRLYKVALEWWRSKRPKYGSLKDHLCQSTINCTSIYEMDLAEAVVEIFSKNNEGKNVHSQD